MSSNKLNRLAEIEGFGSVDEMLSEATFDSSCYGICMNSDCEYTTEVEPDQSHGWCEECGTQSVKSCLILAGLI